MDPKLSEQLQQTLAALLANAQDAAAWTKGQIPSLVQEKILYGRINETVQLLLCLFAVCAGVWTCRGCLRRLEDCDDEIGWGFAIAGSGVFVVVMLFVTAQQTALALMVWLAPRLYIVDWLMGELHK